MSDREIDNLLWGAYLLGARVVAVKNGGDIGAAEIDEIARVAREIAESEATLEDPTALAIAIPQLAEGLQRLGTQIIRNNRDLAKRILAGCENTIGEKG